MIIFDILRWTLFLYRYFFYGITIQSRMQMQDVRSGIVWQIFWIYISIIYFQLNDFTMKIWVHFMRLSINYHLIELYVNESCYIMFFCFSHTHWISQILSSIFLKFCHKTPIEIIFKWHRFLILVDKQFFCLSVLICMISRLFNIFSYSFSLF